MEKGSELVPMCDFAISKNESKKAKGEEKSKQQKIGDEIGPPKVGSK